MIYISRCTIGFMAVVFISGFGCNSDERIENHLQALNKINPNISTEKWEVFDGFVDEQEEHFELEKHKADTSYLLSFSYFPTPDKYIVDGFSQSFIAKGHYHELSILDNDTMYHYFSTTEIELNKSKMLSLDDQCFIVGKYYYLYLNGWLSEQQMKYFDLHKDSLTKVRGDELVDLPGAK